jgi:hypothetical protein
MLLAPVSSTASFQVALWNLVKSRVIGVAKNRHLCHGETEKKNYSVPRR